MVVKAVMAPLFTGVGVLRIFFCGHLWEAKGKAARNRMSLLPSRFGGVLIIFNIFLSFALKNSKKK